MGVTGDGAWLGPGVWSAVELGLGSKRRPELQLPLLRGELFGSKSPWGARGQ